tara:strand:- start:709 stop:1146 length:438 start_codon:yes stop_codon:yes gene_type:complete
MKRIDINELEPKAYEAMFSLDKYVGQTDVSKVHQDLIKIRASQLNGCAFCIDMHINDALKSGELPRRLYLLNAWEKSKLFSEEEEIILKITEKLTRIGSGLSEELYQKGTSLLGEKYMAQVIVIIAAINAWNRIGIGTAKAPIGI